MLRKPRLALFGAGHMGGAMLRGWARSKKLQPTGSFLAVDPHLNDEITELVHSHGGRCAERTDEDQLSKLETLVLAVKPQQFDQLANTLAPILPEKVMIISVIAGITLKRMEDAFGAGARVRAMPNTAAEVRKSITVLCASQATSRTEMNKAKSLMRGIGKVEEVQDERQMDVVTAVSGSGPAYFYLLAEALAAAGEQEGLDPQMSRRLARETFLGSAELLSNSGLFPSDLRAAVTSPGGTTAAALDVLMGNGAFAEVTRNAVTAATRRSIQLRNQS